LFSVFYFIIYKSLDKILVQLNLMKQCKIRHLYTFEEANMHVAGSKAALYSYV